MNQFENRELTPEEKWEQAWLDDAFIFYKVMTENPDICKKLIEVLLNIKIEKLELVGEKIMFADFTSKGIRMDIYAKNADKTFDLEIQVLDTKELPERSRYYQSVIDVDTLKKGEFYSDLKDGHIIFICMKDIFKKERAIYNFQNFCEEDKEIKLNDRTYKHFFIAENYDKIEKETEVKAFLKMLATRKTETNLAKEIETKIIKAKTNIDTRRGFMEWDRFIAYQRKDAADIALKQGISQGEQKAKLEAARKLIQMHLGTLEQIAQAQGLPLEEVQALAETK